MTGKDFGIKWLAYGLALLPVWFLHSFVFNRFPVWGAIPMLLPLAAVAVATLEGALAGAGYGLAVGMLMDAVLPGPGGMMSFALAAVGFGAGLLAQFVLRQDLVGCLVCSALSLCVIDLFHILPRLFLGQAPLVPMLELAGRELGWSLVFVPPVYLLYHWVYDRVPKATVL